MPSVQLESTLDNIETCRLSEDRRQTSARLPLLYPHTVTRASKVIRIPSCTSTLGLYRLKQIHIEDMRRLDTKRNLIIQAAHMPFFRLPTLLTLTSIQVLLDIAYHHVHTFQAPQFENNEE